MILTLSFTLQFTERINGGDILIRAVMILAEGFEEIEAIATADVLRRLNIDLKLVGLKDGDVEGSHGISVVPDMNIDDVEEYDVIVLPGGSPGYINLKKDGRVLNLIRDAFDRKKLVAAICASPTVLASSGILKGKRATVYPGMEKEIEEAGGIFDDKLVVKDGNIITSRGPATAMLFGLKIGEELVDKNKVEEVREKLLMNLIGL